MQKTRGRYSRERHHSSDQHGYHERVTWQTFWKFELPILEAKRVGIEKKLSARGKELEAYKYCYYKFNQEEKFYNLRSEIKRAELPLELQ